MRASVELLEVRSMLSAAPQIDSISVDTVVAGNHNESVTIAYSDDDAIDPNTVGPLDLTVIGPEGPVSITNVQRTISGNTLTAVYRLGAPGGIWSALDNGTYSVTVNDGQVADFEGQAVPAQTTTFNVSVPDAAVPTSSISAPDINAASSDPYTVVVTYADAGGIDTTTIGSDDISITGPDSIALNLKTVDVSANTDGTVATATYTFDPAGGAWDPADNGSYTVALSAGAVKDASGNDVAAKTKSFSVNIPNPDVSGPTTTISAADLSTPGTSHTITIEYNDDSGVAAGSIDTNDITVTGPGGATATVASVSKDSSNGGKKIVATYKLTGPGGSWSGDDNGTYTVSLAANAVTDKKSNGVAADSDTFKVSIDSTAPQTSVSAPDITSTDGTKTIKVTYTDDHSIDVATIGADDISITGASNLTIASVSTDVQNSGKKVVATYTLATPAGGFVTALNGNFLAVIAPGAVKDTSGNSIAEDDDAFVINVPLPDTQDPDATISPINISSGSDTAAVTIVYHDNVAVQRSTIGTGDITVAGPGGALTVRDVSVDSDSNTGTITATYNIVGPGGSWDIADNGDYSVTLNGGEVTDTSNRGVAGAIQAFNVNIAPTDTGAPVAAIGAITGITAAGTNDVSVSVTYTDDLGVDASTIGSDDISVTGPAGTLTVSSVVANSSGDGKTIAVTYTIAAPAGGWTFSHDGTYTVTVKSNQVRDISAKPATAVSATFTVAVASPEPIDGTFGGVGGANTSFVTESITTQADGTILLAGHQTVNGASQAVIQRLNAIGAVDTSFGNGGTIVVGGDGNSEAFYAVTMQGADKILVGGTLGGDFLLARYNLDGTIDASFQGGKVVTEVGGLNDTIYGIAIAPDGSIVAAGGGNGNFAFAKYTADGAADLSFSPSGALMFQIDGVTNGLAGAVAVMPDGRIVTAGAADGNVAVIRLRTDGFADTTFSGDGLLIVPGLQSRTDAGLNDHSQGLVIQNDGKLLVSNHDAAGDFAVARIDASGNVDSSFGSAGLATADFGGDDDADALLIQDTGEILAIGTSLANGTGRTGIAAFNSSGSLITGFGTGGMLTLNDNLLPAGRELHVGDLVVRAFGTKQNDGRVVVGSSNGTPGTSALRRLIVPGSRSAPTGSLLGTFGLVNGKTQKLSVTDAGKTTTFSIKGGTGSAFVNGDKINLVITDAGAGTSLTIKVKGGDGRIALGDVTVNGTLKTFSAKTADLSGTLSISAAAGKLTLGEISGTIAAGGSIASLTANNLHEGSRLLAGIGLGTDRKLGGTSGDADSYAAANIGSIKINGFIKQSLIAAGLNPGVDGTFGNDDDEVVGGVASFIKSISVKGTADDATKFVAGAFKSAKIGKGKLDLSTDGRFRVR